MPAETMLLGCIGDDFTGSSDVGNTLAKAGMRVVLYAGVPKAAAAGDVEAGVVALKSRTCPVEEAVAQSLAALRWLEAQGCRQYLFKYCSTFDSTPLGNIGPVADALIEALAAERVIVCPAFPGTGRTLYQGHLFVNDRLLSESGMERHPLTPMTDPDIRRWLARQARHAVGHVAYGCVAQGSAAIAEALRGEQAAGRPLVVVDALSDDDLLAIGRAAADLPLVTGGSGIALGLPENFRRAGLLAAGTPTWSGVAGPAAVISGSCSTATRRQVAHYHRSHPAIEIDADQVVRGELDAGAVAAFLLGNRDAAPIAYSSAEPEAVKAAQTRHGRDVVAAALERLFAETARRLVDGGITRLVVAGGETSGAVVARLGIEALHIGPEIDPGVPALMAQGQRLALALKSGNFGGEDFFARAVAMLGAA
jgi:uncharacterized protein YgbK (DUF1537 family)